MIKKVISLAIALGMIATVFMALNVVAQDISGSIKPYDSGGNGKSVFFAGENVYYQLEYELDGYLASAPFRVGLVDLGGNYLAPIAGHPNPDTVTTPPADVYSSWLYNDYFRIPGGTAAGVYYLKAWFYNTSQLLFTAPITVLAPGIVLTPDQAAYSPGQTVTIEVTVNYDDDINVTIEKDGVIYQKWADEALTDFTWTGDWDIPMDADTGFYEISVNRSDNNATLMWRWIDVEFFTWNIFTDKGAYLPGETAIISWSARSVPDFLPLAITVDFNMSYRDALDGEWKWSNYTGQTDNPFMVDIPEYANVYNDIWVDVTAFSPYNQSSSGVIWIDVAPLEATVGTDTNIYSPGEDMIVTVTASVSGVPVEGAVASVMVYDNLGVVVANLSLSNLTTSTTGSASGILVLPMDIEVGSYSVVATISKLGYTVTDSVTITISDNWIVDVLVIKSLYTAGEDINVEVRVWKNGVSVVPDSVEYWLWLSVGIAMPHVVTSQLNFTIVAPNGVTSDAQVDVWVIAEGQMLWGNSANFRITPLVMELGASQSQYYAGDTVKFSVTTVGDTSGFMFNYVIWDDDSVQIDAGALTMDSKGTADFELDVPDDTPSSSYTARVVADNGLGFVVQDQVTVTWVSAYMLNVWVKSGPAYASGGFAPGQTLTIGFEITKMSEDLPDLTMVTAWVELWSGVSTWWFLYITTGETASFAGMSGDLKLVLPDELGSGEYVLRVFTDVGVGSEAITVKAAGGWDSSIGGMSASEFVMTILIIIVILMLVWMIMKRGGMAPVGAGAKKPEAPKETPKEETYSPKATVKCPACGAPIEVGTSKRPIEVMCPKCGTSQVIS